jgi:hypothetical protein
LLSRSCKRTRDVADDDLRRPAARAAGDADDGRFDFGEASVVAARLHGVTFRPRVDAPGGDVPCFRGNRPDDLVGDERRPYCRHFLEIERDLDFTPRLPIGLYIFDARERLEVLPESRRLCVEGGAVGATGDERELLKDDVRSGKSFNIKAYNPFRERRPKCRRLTEDVVAFAIGIRARRKLNGRQDDALAELRLQFFDVSEPLQACLERVGDEAFKVARGGAWKHSNDRETGNGDDRVFPLRNAKERR